MKVSTQGDTIRFVYDKYNTFRDFDGNMRLVASIGDFAEHFDNTLLGVTEALAPS